MNKIVAYLRLMRPANIITAIADITMGFLASNAISSVEYVKNNFSELQHTEHLFWLILSTIGLYGGGVVFNDVFDADLDKVERPERPIPSGKATLRGAVTLGSCLLLLGIAAAYQVSLISALIAVIISLLALIYDAKGKHHPILGPINMGCCRGGNLLLGVSAFSDNLSVLWWLALIPIVYIASITMVSRGEVHGGNKNALKGAVILYTLVIASILSIKLKIPDFNILQSLPFVLLLCVFIFPPLLKALKSPEPKLIRMAVKAGVISLIVLNASLAAGFAGWLLGLIVLCLLPISMLLAKIFAVT